MATVAPGLSPLPRESAPPIEDPFDPPKTPQKHPQHRYSTFDMRSFALTQTNSPTTAKRALQAHLAETERRLTDASQLGSSLVKQREEISMRLKEIEKQQDEEQLSPELKQKLVDIEKEYNEVSRDAARAFLPKAKSLAAADDDISVSSSPTLSRQVVDSPSKLSVPARKQRNQPSSRVHDIEFATEISTSLLAQVRQLQSLLAEKDEMLKAAVLEKSRLELEAEGFTQRLRALDENEQRYKDENWSLETQTHELMASVREAAEREQRLNASLKTAVDEKLNAQRELDDLQQAHGKLLEDKESTKKYKDTEVMSLRRHLSTHKKEQFQLQQKVNELTTQNEELARIIATRMRAAELDAPSDSSPENEEESRDETSLEGTSPLSPAKATPRHDMLESETLKSSLNHAHRMIQNLKSNITREKAEKFELKRMLQEVKDELDIRRGESTGSVPPPKRQRTRFDKDTFKKPVNPSMLGAVRSPRTDIILDENEWEDNLEERSPTRMPTRFSPPASASVISSRYTTTDTSDNYHTANETDDIYETATERGTEDTAFETARERETSTETDTFQTGAESFENSSDDLTETEDNSSRRQPTTVVTTMPGDRTSFYSTASTSPDEGDEFRDMRTPMQPFPGTRYRLRISRGGVRRTRVSSADHGFFIGSNPSSTRDSPASIISSRRGSAAPNGQSLFAELGNMNADGEEFGTPVRSSSVSQKSVPTTPQSRTGTSKRAFLLGSPLPPLPQRMVSDNGTMTDPLESSPKTAMVDASVLAETPSPSMIDASAYTINSTRDASVFAKPLMSDASVSSEDLIPSARYVSASSETVRFSTRDVSTSSRVPQVDVSTTADTLQPIMRDTWTSADLPTEDKSTSAQDLQPILRDMSTSVEDSADIRYLPRFDRPVTNDQSTCTDLTMKDAASDAFLPAVMDVSTEFKPSVKDDSAFTESPKTVDAALEAICEDESTRERLGSQVSAPSSIMQDSTSQTLEQFSNNQQEASAMPRKQYNDFIGQTVLADDHAISREIVDKIEPDYQDSLCQTVPEIRKVYASADAATQGEADAGALSPAQADLTFSSIKSQGIVPTEPNSSSLQYNPADNAPSSSTAVQDSQKKRFSTAAVQAAENESDANAKQDRKDAKLPLGSISGNATAYREHSQRPKTTSNLDTLDEGSQTLLSSQQIDKILMENAKSQLSSSIVASPAKSSLSASARSPAQNKSLAASRSSGSQSESSAMILTSRRPTSANSAGASSRLPAPSDHKHRLPTPETPSRGNMGPPFAPASAYRTSQTGPRSPNQQATTSHEDLVPRPKYSRSQAPSRASRRSSITSFASECDERFNIRQSNVIPHAMPSSTDPRMIQAITQTMIGEYLWKYTRKAGRGEISDNRHRRFFWVHPYTRTLYWSDRDPATAGRLELKTKSVAIEAVRVVADDNPMPPGLHRKSLIVITPSRSIKFTATTGQRHETWFNALSYLLLRTNSEAENDALDATHQLTSDDVDEFNPSARYVQTPTSEQRHSLSSFNSQATSYTADNQRPSSTTPSHRPSGKALSAASTKRMTPRSISRLSTIIRGSFSSKRGKIGGLEAEASVHDAPLVQDNTEDAEEVADEQSHHCQEESDKLENVRACCDGKHDVSSLSRKTGQSSFASRHSTR